MPGKSQNSSLLRRKREIVFYHNNASSQQKTDALRIESLEYLTSGPDLVIFFVPQIIIRGKFWNPYGVLLCDQIKINFCNDKNNT
jgi:hypothetical protein